MSKAIQLFLFCLALVCVSPNNAIVTYHLYKKTDSLTTVACSDGANGLMSWGYKDLSLVFPYVTAWQPASWNSPQCGSCAKITWNGKFTYVTVIDQCGVINSAYSHFDMSREAFYGLFGDLGIAKGTMYANFTIVSSIYCPGNKKGVRSPTPIPWISQGQEYGKQQNLRSEDTSKPKNPLWVKSTSATHQTLNFQSGQEGQQSGNNIEQSSSEYQNPLWVKGSQAGVEFGGTDTVNQWGGYSYDKQNQRDQRERD